MASSDLHILAFSDIHADDDALDRLRPLAMREDYDAVICAGDLTNRGPISFAKDLLDLFGDKFYFVHGNMDPPAVLDLMRSHPHYLHGRKVRLGSWNLIGLGGSNPTPFHTPSELSEAQIEHILNSAEVDARTILVSHPPPQGLFDSVGDLHVGSSSVRRCIEDKKPLLALCGHIHEQEGQAILGDTLVVKLGPALARRAADISIGEDIRADFISF